MSGVRDSRLRRTVYLHLGGKSGAGSGGIRQVIGGMHECGLRSGPGALPGIDTGSPEVLTDADDGGPDMLAGVDEPVPDFGEAGADDRAALDKPVLDAGDPDIGDEDVE